MATYTWKKCTSNVNGLVIREEGGCIVLDSYVTGSDVVMITLPLSYLQEIRVAVAPSGSVVLTDQTIEYSETD